VLNPLNCLRTGADVSVCEHGDKLSCSVKEGIAWTLQRIWTTKRK